MKLWKRLLSIALVLALVLSSGFTAAFIQANAEISTSAAEEVENAGANELTSWSGTQTFADGWIEAQIKLPQIKSADWKSYAAASAANANAGSNATYTVEFLINGSNYIRASMIIHRNEERITFKLDVPASLGDLVKVSKKTGSYNYVVHEGQTVTVKLRKIGNFMEVLFMDQSGNVMQTWGYTVAAGAAFHNVNNWRAKVNGGASGQLCTGINQQTQQPELLALKASFTSIVVGKFNRTVRLSAGANVTLPVNKTVTEITLARSAYEVGEILPVNIGAGYTLYANDTPVEDPQHFMIPDAEEVALSARIVTYCDVTVVPAAGITVTPNQNVESGTTVTVTVDTELLNPATLKVTGASGEVKVSGSNGVYTFIMPAEPVTVTCNEMAANEVVETAGAADLSNWNGTQTFADGWIETQIKLPQIPETDWQASVDAMTAAWDATKTNPGSNIERRVELFNGSNYIRASLTVHRNSKEITFQLDMPASLTGAAVKKTVKTAAHNQIVFEGQTVTLQVRKIGNYAEILLKDADGNVLETWAFTIAADAAFHSITDWSAKVSSAKNGVFGKAWDAENGLTDLIDTNTYFTSVSVGRINKTVLLTADANVTLPVTTTASGAELARTAYQAGEVITIGVAAGYDLYANDTLVEDSQHFVIPHAKEVALSTQLSLSYSVTVAPAEGITVSHSTNVAAGTIVTITVDTGSLDPATLKVTGASGEVAVSGSDGTYIFVMPESSVVVTCDVPPAPVGPETAGSATLTDWTGEKKITDGWIEAQIQLPQIPEADWQTYASISAANGNAGKNATYAVEFTSGSYYIRASMILHRNENRITFKLDTPAALGEQIQVSKKTGSYNYVVHEGQTVTVKLRKIGNFIEVVFADQAGKTMQTWGYTVADGAAFHAVVDWKAKVSGGAGGRFCTGLNEQTQQPELMEKAAYFTGITVDSYAKTVAIIAEENVALPVTKTISDTALARTAFAVGEPLRLSVNAGYELYANDVLINDPAGFKVPNVETVTLTCKQLDQINPDIFDNFDAESLMIARKWNREMVIVQGAARAFGSTSSYLSAVAGSKQWSSYTASATITVYGATAESTAIAALCVKTASTSGGYEFGVAFNAGSQTGYVRLYDRTNGVMLFDGKGTKVTYGQACDLKLVVTGNTITGYMNGAWIFSVNVEDTVGGVGIRAQNVNASYDNLKVTDIVTK